MLRSNKINRICCICLVVMLVATTLLWGAIEPINASGSSRSIGYEERLFDTSCVHEIDITASDWDSMIQNAASEEYIVCDLVVDGEKYNNIAIRPKGNTSLSSVTTMGSERYSFKVEFDHYDNNVSYHGLDKLSLNNLIQDATAMKDYIAYTLMNKMGVPAPLCSYVKIYVNGEYWGLYLAVEGVEDSYLDRNNMASGDLYKPDSMSFGGGRGNGGNFNIDDFRTDDTDTSATDAADTGTAAPTETAATASTDFISSFGGSSSTTDFTPSSGASSDSSTPSFSFTPSTDGSWTPPTDMGDFNSASFDTSSFGGFSFNFGMGSDDVKLIYSDDDESSYSNIFNNAKTLVTSADKARLIASIKKLNEGDTSVVNTDEVIRYLAVHSFLCNDDSYTGMMVHNYYLYEEDGVLTIIPWDYNLSLGGFSASTNATSTVNSSIDSPVSGGTTASRPLIAWIFENDETLSEYHEVYNEFLTTCLENGWLENELDRVWAMIRPCLEDDPTKFYTMDEFDLGVSTMKTFIEKRTQAIRGQLDGTNETIDASDISTADMGSMNSTNGGGMSMPDTSKFDFSSMAGGAQRPDAAAGTAPAVSPEATAGDGAAVSTEPTLSVAPTDAAASSGASSGDASSIPDTGAFAASDGTQAGTQPAVSVEAAVSAEPTVSAAPTAAATDAAASSGAQDFTASSGNAAPADGTTVPEGTMPDMSGFTASNGAQASATDAVSAEPTLTAEPEAEASAEAATDVPAKPEAHSAAPQNIPDGISFSGTGSGYPTSTWIWLGALALVMLGAVILIRKAPGHN